MRVAWNVAPAALDAPISISNGGFPGEAGASAISSDRAGWLNNELLRTLGQMIFGMEFVMNKKWKCPVCGYIHDGEIPPDVCPVCGAYKYQFILYEKLAENLEKILKEAFAGESKAHVRNLAFAKKAEEDGFPQVARLFRAVAEAEKIHAAEYLKYLEGVIGETEDNLQAAFEREIRAKNEIYPPLIQEAFASKREDVAWSFSRSRDVEERHAKLYKDALAAMITDQETVYHVCQVCGYIFDGDLPEKCPVCKAKKENFKRID